MSREEFRNFVNTIERNILLKDKIFRCNKLSDLIILDKTYGYNISLKDFDYSKTAIEFESWQEKSTINPMK